MLDLIDIGEAVKRERKLRKLSQSQVAEAAGLSRARLESLENGRAADIGFKNLVRVMNAVGLDLRMTDANMNRPTLDDLMGEAGHAPRMGR